MLRLDKSGGRLYPVVEQDGDAAVPKYLDPVPRCRGDGHGSICKKCLGDRAVDFSFLNPAAGGARKPVKKKKCTRCQLRKPLAEFFVKDTPCSLWERCTYKKAGKCKVEVLYLESVFDPILDPVSGIGDRLSDMDLQQVTFHLFPLYHQLITLKKEALRIENDAVYMTDKGLLKIHPIFKEIRDLIGLITHVRKGLGLEEKWQDKFATQAPKPAGSGGGDILPRGDQEHVERISAE